MCSAALSPGKMRVLYTHSHPALARSSRYYTWSECERQVKGFGGNLYRGFATEAEASAFLSSNGVKVQATEGPGTSRERIGAAERLHVEPPTSCERALMFFDGASKGNPGDAGFGAVIFDRDSGDTEQVMKVIREVKGFMAEETNNVAEYSGLVAGLAACLETGVKDVHVKGDSKLVINQVNGQWKVKNENLMRYHRVARRLAGAYHSDSDADHPPTPITSPSHQARPVSRPVSRLQIASSISRRSTCTGSSTRTRTA